MTTEPVQLSVLERAVANATDLRPRTKALYLECVRSFLIHAGTEPDNWTVGTVEDWLVSLLSSRKPQTVRVYRKAIRYASRRYAKREAAKGAVDFAHLADAIKAEKPERDPVLDTDELGKLLRTCNSNSLVDIRDYALIVVAARTGLRRGGLYAMEWAGVDYEQGKITTAQKGGGTISFEADEETLNALRTWRKGINDANVGKVAVGPVFMRVHTFSTPEGRAKFSVVSEERMSEWQIWDVFNRRSSQAGIRHVHPHLMRHSTVTWLREAGVSSMEVRRLTGQTEKTIEDIYTHSRKTGAVGAALPTMVASSKRKKEDEG